MMLAIRMSHFGTAHLLPDASLAVFLLGGLLLRRGYFFIILMLLAFGMDVYVARNATDIGCVLSQPISVALPAYGVLWLTGVGLAGRQRYAQPLLALSASVIGVGLAFIISNAFWYALSGKFVALNLIEFSLRVVKYFPPYLGSAMLYLAPALIAGGFWRKARVVA